MKYTQRKIYVLVVSLAVLSGLVFANRGSKNETMASSLQEKEKWEKSPYGIRYKEWELSPAGKKVHASYDKIKKEINTFSEMEAVVSSVTFQRENAKSSGPKWLIVRIQGEEYMMQFVPNEFQQLQNLQVNDKIIVKSRSAGYSPNHPYLILSGDYIALKKQVLFKRDFSKNKGC
jgi:hypothetical protein